MIKKALIISGTSDLGYALAEELAERGVSLILTGRDEKQLSSIKSDLSIRFKITVEVIVFSIKPMQSEFPFGKIPEDNFPDLTIWTIGQLGEQEKAFLDKKLASRIIETNYTQPVYILNTIAEKYKNNKHGGIIGISSVAGERGRQSNFIYGSAKAGFSSYLSGLRNMLFPFGVHVLTVKPGFMQTQMIENIYTPGILTISPKKAAKKIIKAYLRKNNTLYVYGSWRLIMFIIKTIPEFIFKRLKL